MSGKHSSITRVTSEQLLHMEDQTDFARLDAMTDADIAKAAAEDPDSFPPDPDIWKDARLVIPPGKSLVTMRIDRDVLDWFQARGRGYQTRINAVLRSFMEAQDRPR